MAESYLLVTVKPAAAGDSFAIYKLQPKGSVKEV